MHPVESLVDTAHVADVGMRGQPHPHLHVAGVRQPGIVSAHPLLQRRADHDLRRGDAAVRVTEAPLEPPVARPDRPARHLGPGRGQRLPMLEVQRVTVDETDLWVGVEQVGGAAQRSGGQPVVRGYQDGVVTVGPLEQALVVGGDVPFVAGVGGHLHARVAAAICRATSALPSGDASSMIRTRTSTPSWSSSAPSMASSR